MPYIEGKRRAELDPLILPLTMFPVEDEKTDGEITYVLCRIIDGVYGSGNYATKARGVGVVVSAILEYYRKVLAPYENGKCQKQGEVFETQ